MSDEKDTDKNADKGDFTPPPPVVAKKNDPPAGAALVFPSTLNNVLAQYSIPLGANSAQLTFTGRELVPDDFDALLEYVTLFKKQFERSKKIADAQRAQVADDFRTYGHGELPKED